jgi:hypothetical protein
MAKGNVLPVVSAAVTPAIMEEIDRLAASTKRSRSEVVRTLLEERLTERANERMEAAYSQVDKRLAKMDQRFSGLLVKAIRLIAHDLYLTQYELKNFTSIEEDEYHTVREKAKTFAGDQLKQAFEKADTQP